MNPLSMLKFVLVLELVEKKTGKKVMASNAVLTSSEEFDGFLDFAGDCLRDHFLNGREGLKNGKDTDHYFPFPDECMLGGVNPDRMINSFVIRDSAELDTIPTYIGVELSVLEKLDLAG